MFHPPTGHYRTPSTSTQRSISCTDRCTTGCCLGRAHSTSTSSRTPFDSLWRGMGRLSEPPWRIVAMQAELLKWVLPCIDPNLETPGLHCRSRSRSLRSRKKMFHYSIPARSRSAGSSRFRITYVPGMLAAFKENVPPVGLHAVAIDVQNLN